MQIHELESWLGDNHGLNAEEMDEIQRAADDLTARYPDPDDAHLREHALTASYRLIVERTDDVLEDFGKQRTAARAAEAGASAALQQLARTLIPRGDLSEAGFARLANVDRMTVRKWLGK